MVEVHVYNFVWIFDGTHQIGILMRQKYNLFALLRFFDPPYTRFIYMRPRQLFHHEYSDGS